MSELLDRFALTGKVAIVTGGTGLYGLPFARGLADAGARVVVTSRSADSARETAARLTDEGSAAGGARSVIGLRLDQSDPASIDEFADSVISECGGVDVLVNNTVHRQGAGLSNTNADDWDATSATNARGLFLLTQRISAAMIDQGRGGAVINIGSIYGIVAPDFPIYEGTPVVPPIFYSYDKAGMIGLTRYLAGALGPHNIRVNCLCPGGLGTDDGDSAFAAHYATRTPLQRMANSDDVTPALVFLASDAARYITGITLPVDGGWTSH
jgi:NAD(P)-dependent dehydrogenase (short-subunit alcohol dehydrogenase family)